MEYSPRKYVRFLEVSGNFSRSVSQSYGFGFNIHEGFKLHDTIPETTRAAIQRIKIWLIMVVEKTNYLYARQLL